MAIYLTGDTHRDISISKLSTTNLRAAGHTIGENDFLIILGDGGFVWDGSNSDLYWQKWLEGKPWTTIVIPGNHENYNLLQLYPLVEFNGAAAREINSKLFYIERGYIMELEGLKFFCMGGAQSHDMAYRTEGKSWWKEELPNSTEFARGIDTLSQEGINFSIDYLLTHCAGTHIAHKMGYYSQDYLTNYLYYLEKEYNLQFKHNYFGHYHRDEQIDDLHTCLYNKIIKLE